MLLNGTSGDDVLSASLGDDTIFGFDGEDSLYAHAGIDHLDGGNGNDELYGGSENDFLFGGAGDDYLVGEWDNDVIDGGSGDHDTASYYNSSSSVTASLVSLTSSGGQGIDTFISIEGLAGSPFNDLLTGDNGSNYLYGDDGNDTLSGGDGNDAVEGGMGNDSVAGGNGDDRLEGGPGDDTVNGGGTGSYGDTVEFYGATTGVVVNLLTGLASDGMGGTDTLLGVENANGTEFADAFQGNSFNNIFQPGAGDDTVVGGGGRDAVSYEQMGSFVGVTINLITGTASSSTIGTDSLTGIQAAGGTFAGDSITLSNTSGGFVYGLGGNDTMAGGTGDDNFFPGSGVDVITGGLGFDQIDYSDDADDNLNLLTGNGVTVNLIAGTAIDKWGQVDTFIGIEQVVGSQYADMLIGGNPLNGTGATGGFESFAGNGGNDTIIGGAGYDRATYQTSPGPVNVTLGGASNGTASDGFGGTDLLTSIEEARGSSFADTLTGSADNLFEAFEGRGGNDTINGVAGTDRVSYQTSSSGVSVNLTTGTASDGFGGTDTLLNIDNVRGSDSSDTLVGNSGANDFEARVGNDLMQGLLGEDTFRGGLGNDTIDGGFTVLLSNSASANNEYDTANYSDATTGGVTVVLGVDGTAGTAIGADIGTDSLIGIERVYGTNFGDVISGTNRELNEIIRGGLGNDTLNGGAGGSDLGFNLVEYRTASGSVTVNLASGIATGADGNDVLANFRGILSGDFDDLLTGDATDNHIEGHSGNDTIDGGAGNDRASYSNATSGVTVNLLTGTSSGAAGVDNLVSIENLRGSEFADSLTGDSVTNEIQARSGNDTVVAGAGEDTVYGGLGDDSLDGGTNDPLLGWDWAAYSTANGAVTVNLLTGTASGAEGNDSLANFEAVLGSGFGDSLTGDTFDNVLRGNGGDDTLNGGAGNDWVDYTSASGSVTVSLVTQTSSGADGSDTFTNMERIRGGSHNDTLTGDTGDNRLRGNQGNDTLDGGAGTDGADYRNATGAVTVRLDLGTSSGADGNDTLISIEDALGSFTYGDDLVGSAGANAIDGRGGQDTLEGGFGNDTLTGGSGNDTLDGGDGTDTALFASAFAANSITAETATGDLIVTGPEGTDRLKNIEILQFTDFSFIIELGSATSDNLEGGVESEMIRGLEGNDTVEGGGGDDALYGDEGTDTIDGGSGNDFLDGGTGNDSMTGGTGDDTYVVDSSGDVIVETNGVAALIKDPLADNPGGGIDTVISSINFTLGSFLENLQLVLNAGNLNGTGNSLSNILTGNTQNNLLTGADGNDSLEGSDGVDTAGFAGNRSAYTLGPLGQATTSVTSGAEGADTLSHVERLQFADGRVAIDSQGSAGLAAKVIGTLFGNGALSDRALVGQYLAQFDTGISLEEGMAAAISSARFVQLAGSHDNTAYVNLVYQNLAGVPPDTATRDFLLGALNAGMTQASMSVLASDYVAGMNAFPTGIAYELQEGTAVTGTSGNDTLSGTAAGNVMFGREGNDVLTGLTGNDLISGGAGIDRAVYASTTKAAATVARNDVGMQVTTASEGTDTLTQVERITYSNISAAYDISGNAGSVAKIIGAIFGPAALQDEALVGQYLAMLDAGMTYEEVTGAAAASSRFATDAGGHSNAQFVDRVYFNIAGFLPSADVAAPLVALLDSPGYTQAYLGSLAADVSYNVANVNLTGLAATGLEYTVTV